MAKKKSVPPAFINAVKSKGGKKGKKGGAPMPMPKPGMKKGAC